MNGWYPVFLREMLLFRRRLFKLGYVFSSLFVPFLYLVAFGLGLGKNVHVAGQSYVEFLVPGLVAMSSMNNAYSSVSVNLSMSRTYFKTFQVLVQAPIGPSAIVIGEILAGVVRGLFASTMILLVGVALSGVSPLRGTFLTALLANCLLFSALGVVVGMRTRNLEDTSIFSNFIIMPMAFFGGTFFPLEKVPQVFKGIILILPLTHTNILIRSPGMDLRSWISLGVLCAYCILFLIWGARLVRGYNE